MSVFNHASGVQNTIESILQQNDVELDFIIVDDGSQAEVKKVLERYKHEPCINIVTQENQGLTVALIKGCSLAKYDYIARIDAGDIAKPDRLRKQAQFLQNNLKVACVTSWVSMLTEEGHHLYDVKLSKQQLQLGLASEKVEQLHGPAHFSTMFRNKAYQQAGEYRKQFYFAQDLDLWLRMQHFGEFDVLPEVLTIAEFSASAISGRYRNQQEQLKKYALQAELLRRNKEDENEILQQASAVQPEKNNAADNTEGLYFIARCLSKNKNRAAIKYYLKIIRQEPLNLKAWLGMLQAYILY